MNEIKDIENDTYFVAYNDDEVKHCGSAQIGQTVTSGLDKFLSNTDLDQLVIEAINAGLTVDASMWETQIPNEI